MPDNAQRLMTAISAVRKASVVCRAVQQQLIDADTLTKKDKSPVTVADFASQALVCKTLSDALPDDPVVGEEDAAELRQDDQATIRASVLQQVESVWDNCIDEETILSWIDLGGAAADTDRYWTLDPIDGTKGFLRKEQYAVALALIESGQVTLGVLGCPNLPFGDKHGALLVAEKDKGTRLISLWDEDDTTGQPIQVSDITDPANACFCESVESGHSDQDQSVQIAKQLNITRDAVRMDSQAKYATVARGEAQIYLRLPTRKDYREKIWDHAAGMLVVEEAGGKVTDVHGNSLDFTHGRTLDKNQGVIATNGPIHDQVVSVVKQVLEI